jgi:hypothetical protein
MHYDAVFANVNTTVANGVAMFSDVNTLLGKELWKPAICCAHPSDATREIPSEALFLMAFSHAKPQLAIPPAAPSIPTNETYRAKSIATRLTEAEFAEVESAATKAGKKVAEWLREAALTRARAAQEEPTDPILLAEIMGMRTLMLNLFARASQGPLSTEDLRKMSAYADSIKEQKAREFLAQRRLRNGSEKPEKTP